MNYQDALQTIKNRQSKKLGNNTYLERNTDGSLAVRLHQTQIIKLYPDYCQLFTGGWHTATTKDRLNSYAPTTIIQHLHIWYISQVGYNFDKITDLPLFYEGIKLNYHGNIISPLKESVKVVNLNKKIKADIKRYVTKAMRKLAEGLPLPSGADCWYCSMRTQDGQVLGEASNSDHLKSHVREGYIVPSLLFNAVSEAGYRYPSIILGYEEKTMKSTSEVNWNVANVLRKYLQKRLLVNP